MAIRNGELMHECFTKHSQMGTARMKCDNKTEEEKPRREERLCEVKRKLNEESHRPNQC